MAIGHRRGIAARAVAMLTGLLRPQRGLPHRLASPIERQNPIHSVARGGEEDVLVPNDGRGAALTRQGRFPKHVGRVPLHGIGPLLGAAVVSSTAPVWPIWGKERPQSRQHQTGDQLLYFEKPDFEVLGSELDFVHVY